MAPQSKCSWCGALVGAKVGQKAGPHQEKGTFKTCPGKDQPTVKIK